MDELDEIHAEIEKVAYSPTSDPLFREFPYSGRRLQATGRTITLRGSARDMYADERGNTHVRLARSDQGYRESAPAIRSSIGTCRSSSTTTGHCFPQSPLS